jgi:hypothetical protein
VRGSALECAAIQDVLVVAKGLDKEQSRQRKNKQNRSFCPFQYHKISTANALINTEIAK